MQKFRISVFGKTGCDKCRLLNQRLDKILESPEWKDFKKDYWDLGSVEGLVAFARTEVLSPQRIPAFQVELYNVASRKYEPIPENVGAQRPEETKAPRYPTFLGIQTNYKNGGVITPKDIRSVLRAALELAQ